MLHLEDIFTYSTGEGLCVSKVHIIFDNCWFLKVHSAFVEFGIYECLTYGVLSVYSTTEEG